jgi:hypothetical protein
MQQRVWDESDYRINMWRVTLGGAYWAFVRLSRKCEGYFTVWTRLHVNVVLGFILFVSAAQRGPRPPRSKGLAITQNDATQSVRLLWSSDQFVVEISSWQHTTLTRNRYPCPWWDSKPQSQRASGRRPTP